MGYQSRPHKKLSRYRAFEDSTPLEILVRLLLSLNTLQVCLFTYRACICPLFLFPSRRILDSPLVLPVHFIVLPLLP